jgi:hypothetical protein
MGPRSCPGHTFFQWEFSKLTTSVGECSSQSVACLRPLVGRKSLIKRLADPPRSDLGAVGMGAAISVYGLDGGMWSKLALPPKTLTSRSANGRRTSKVAAEGTIHQKETFEVGKRTDGAENRTSSAGSPAHERPCSTNMTDRRLNLAVHLARLLGVVPAAWF